MGTQLSLSVMRCAAPSSVRAGTPQRPDNVQQQWGAKQNKLNVNQVKKKNKQKQKNPRRENLWNERRNWGRKAVTSDAEVKGLMGNKQGITDMLLKLKRAKFCFLCLRFPPARRTDAAWDWNSVHLLNSQDEKQKKKGGRGKPTKKK